MSLECPLCDWTRRDDERADAAVATHLRRAHPGVDEETVRRAWAERELRDALERRR